MPETQSGPTGIKPKRHYFLTTVVPSLDACVWYSLSDLVRSRKRRAAAKTVMLASSVLYGAYLGRVTFANEAASGGVKREAVDPDESPGDPVVQGLKMVAFLVPLTAGAFAAEWVIHRAGEGLATRGVTYPHTKIGLVMGCLTPLAQRATTLVSETITSRTST